VWRVEGFKESTKMDHIKVHYFTSHALLNYYGIVPGGPNFIGQLEQEPAREDLSFPRCFCQ